MGNKESRKGREHNETMNKREKGRRTRKTEGK
jgi:hypothetical protein